MKATIVTPCGHYARHHSDWLSPAFPEWFKSLKNDSISEEDRITARQCPAFINIFKNSFLVKAPQDFAFRVDENDFLGWTYIDESTGFNSVSSHHLESQLGSEWEDWLSVKIDFCAVLIPEKPMSCIFLDPMYHHNRSPFTTLSGAVTLYPDLYSTININMMIRKDEIRGKIISVPKGTPLAYLYFPEGRPKIDVQLCSAEEWHQQYEYIRTQVYGDWISREKTIMARSP